MKWQRFGEASTTAGGVRRGTATVPASGTSTTASCATSYDGGTYLAGAQGRPVRVPGRRTRGTSPWAVRRAATGDPPARSACPDRADGARALPLHLPPSRLPSRRPGRLGLGRLHGGDRAATRVPLPPRLGDVAHLGDPRRHHAVRHAGSSTTGWSQRGQLAAGEARPAVALPRPEGRVHDRPHGRQEVGRPGAARRSRTPA